MQQNALLIEESNYLMSKLLKQDGLRLLEFTPQHRHTQTSVHVIIQNAVLEKFS